MTYISKQKLIFKSFRECLGNEMRKLVLPTLYSMECALVKCNAISGIIAGAQQIKTVLFYNELTDF